MKHRIKFYLDFIPILLVVLYAVISIGKMVNQNNILYWQHYLGITLLLLDIIILFKFHQLGIILFGFTLIAGMLTLVSFDVGLREDSFYITAAKIPVFWGNAICLLWLIIHLICSFRYYVGILTKDYWQKLWSSTSMKVKASTGEPHT